MLSYQHIYHAGCLADIHKHAALTVILNKITEKDKPISYIETHAGRGFYDLLSYESEKTGEAKVGIIKFLARGELSEQHPYTQVIRRAEAEFGADCYPGSPAIADYLLRKDDVMHLMELHPREYMFLEKQIQGTNIYTYNRDGYAGALAISPPQPEKGIVFVDPSYEIKTEYQEMADYLVRLHNKWANAVVLVWYPILRTGLHEMMRRKIEAVGLPDLWQQEVLFEKHKNVGAMYGSGLICINTPLGVENGLAEIATWF
jgi:23S rRNA (adenine2030-N6)-methyltransferase